MRIQLITFGGCPHAASARELLRRTLERSGLECDFDEVDSTVEDTPSSLRTWGSPTILVDGVDAGGEPVGTGPGCRLYPDATGRTTGLPPEAGLRELLARSLTSARRR